MLYSKGGGEKEVLLTKSEKTMTLMRRGEDIVVRILCGLLGMGDVFGGVFEGIDDADKLSIIRA